MKKLTAFSVLLAYIITLPLSGCASVSLSVGGIKASQFRQLSSGQITQEQIIDSWLTQRRPSGSDSSFQLMLIQAQTGSASPYFNGDDGSGIRIAVLEPSANGLTEDEKKWMPSIIQSSITGDFNRFSAMTIIDRQNFEKIIEEQTRSTSGNYSDEDFIRIGNLINARYILVGSVTKTANAYMLELSVTDVESGERKASYPPTQVSSLALENLTAVKEATVVLLEQLGIQLTAQGRQELRKAPDTAAVQAEMALARGIAAQRQGTEVAALSYFFQAAAMNPSLLEAMNRSSILNANILSGNIGQNVRNDIEWRRNWIARLTEAEQSFDQFNRTGAMPYTLFYSDEIKQGAINYRDETVTLSIETNLHPSHTWGYTVGIPMQRTLRAVYDGLQATQRADVWELNSWPNRGVTNLNSFARRNSNFTIVAELLNDQNRVIGRQSFRTDGWWEYTYNGYAPSGVRISDDDRTTVNFTVKANDITDKLTIRIASVNGTPAETAARNGVLQIRAVPKAQYDNDRDNSYQFAFGGYRGNSKDLVIPIIWGETVIGNAFANKQLTGVTIGYGVTSIGESAFANNQLTRVIIPASVTSIGNSAFANNRLSSVTIPDSVTSIGESAFANNNLTSVTIPNSVTSIGSYAFFNNNISRIIIGANVSVDANIFGFFGFNFAGYYNAQGRRAGQYDFSGNRWYFRTQEQVQADAEKERAEREAEREERAERVAAEWERKAERERFWSSPGGTVLKIIGYGAFIAIVILFIINSSQEETSIN